MRTLTVADSGRLHTHTVVFLHGRDDRAKNFATGLGRWCDSRNRNQADAFPTFRSRGPKTWPRWMVLNEVAVLGGRWDRIVLAGISMSGATSSHFLINLKEPLGSFMEFSAWLFGLEDVPDHDDILRKSPVLLEHCVNDLLVLLQNGWGLRDTLRRLGCWVEWKKYPNGGHWFQSPNGGDDAVLLLA
ncbi:phospholipase/carboxylesterase family protein [Xylaria cf. heliscus]|nr:phospholipase/carboxylesterase family protein [Xylaria cf. heliscus]